MSNEIETRVVKMVFDNKEFEKNVKKSLITLEDLKKSLDLDKATASLAQIERKMNKLDFSGLSNAIDAIGHKFSVLGTMGDQALRRITDSMMNLGKKAFGELITGPINEGFNKYEQKIAAVQQIAGATGMSVQQIEPYLQELMKYSDDTSYSFSDMISSFSKFLNSGVNAEVAVKAIKGINNEAASAGATVAQAGHAMYNFAQALGQGYVGLLDWKSIQNANMDTLEFKEALIQTAKEMKILKKNSKVTAENFNSTLNKKWLTTDVLLTTLERYNNLEDELGAKAFKMAKETKTFTEMVNYLKDSVSTGWMTTWELIFGNYDKAVNLWTMLGDSIGEVFSNATEKRNDMLKEWNKMGGRKLLIGGVLRIGETISSIAGAAQEGWRQIFPETTWQGLWSITDRFRLFAVAVRDFFNGTAADGEGRLSKISRIFAGIASVAKIFLKVLKPIFGFVTKLAGKVIDPILEGMARLGDYFKFLAGEGDFVNIFEPLAEGLLTFVGIIFSYIPKAVDWIVKLVKKIYGFFESKGIIKDLTKGFSILLNGLNERLPAVVALFAKGAKELWKWATTSETVKNALEKLKEFFKPFVDKAKEFGGVFKEAFDEMLGVDTSNIEGFGDKIKARLAPFKKVGDWISNEFQAFKEKIFKKYPAVKQAYDKVKEVISLIKDKLLRMIWSDQVVDSGLADKMGVLFTLKHILYKIQDIFSIGGSVIKTTVLDKYQTAVTKIKDFVKNFNESVQASGGSLKVWLKGKMQTFLDNVTKLIAWIKEKFSMFDLAFIGGAISWVGMMVKLLVKIKFFMDAASTVKSWNANGLFGRLRGEDEPDSIADKVLKIAVAIGIMVAAIAWIATMKPEEIKKGLSVLGALAGGIIIFLGLARLVGGNSGVGSTSIKDLGKAILSMGVGVLMIYFAIQNLGKMNPDVLLQGLVAMAAIVVELGIFARLAGGNKINGGGLIATAFALLTLLIPINILANMSTDSLVKGIGALTILLGVLGAFIVLTGSNKAIDAKKFTQTNNHLMSMAVALTILMIPVSIMANMSIEQLAKGLGGIAIMLLAIGASAKLMGNSAKEFGPTIMSAAIGLTILTVPVMMLGKMKTKNLIKGVGAVVVLVAAIALLSKVTEKSPKVGGMIGAMAVLVVGLTAFALALQFVKDIDTDKIVGFAVGFAAVVLSVGVVVKLLGSSAGPTAILGALKAAVAIITFVLTLGIGLTAIGWAMKAAMDNGIDIVGLMEEGQKAFEAVGKAIGSIIGGFIKGVFGEAKSPVEVMNDMKTVAGGLKEFGDVAGEVNVTNVNSIAGCITELGKAFKSGPRTGGWLQKLLGEFDADKFSTDLPKIGKGLSEFSTNVENVKPDHATACANALKVLVSLTRKIPTEGGFLGMISKGLFGITDYEKLRKDLAAMGRALYAYAQVTAKIKADHVASTANTLKILMLLTNQVPKSGGILNAVAKKIFGVDDYGLLKKELEGLGEALVAFATKTEGISAAAVTRSGTALKILMALTEEVPTTGGLFGWLKDNFIGKSGTLNLATDLGVLGLGLAAFAWTTSGIDDAKVKSTADAMEVLANICKEVHGTGGWWQAIIGESGAGKFGDDLKTLGTGIKGFADETKNLKTNQVKNAAKAAEALATLGNALPASGGLWQIIVGNKSIANFGGQMKELANGIVDFAKIIKEGGLDTDEFKKGADAGTMLQELESKLPAQDGVLQSLVGQRKLSEFGRELPALARGLVRFNNKVQEIQDTSAADRAGTIIGKLSDLGTVVNAFNNNYDITMFGTHIGDCGEVMLDFSNTMSKVNPAGLAMTLGTMETMLGLFQTFADDPALQKGGQNVAWALKNFLMDENHNGWHSLSYLEEIGKQITLGIGKGIQELYGTTGNNSFKNDVKAIGEAFAYTLEDYYDVAKRIGHDISSGVARGMIENIGTVQSAGGIVGISATQPIKEKTKVSSPSKVTYEYGKYIAFGLANGIRDYAYKAENEAGDAGVSAVTAMQDIYDMFNAAIEGPSNPVITPIVDMSNVYGSANEINRAFQTRPTITTSPFSAARNAYYNIEDQNGSNAIINALNNLDDRLIELGDTISQMRVVMDSGALVGQIEGQIDRRLAFRNNLARRGV